MLGVDARAPESTTGRARSSPPSTKRLVWGISIVAALLVALVGAGALAVVLGTRSIPVVTDLRGAVAEGDGTSVMFTWDDPGLRAGDAYVVAINGAASPPQRTATIAVPAGDGDHVCAVVTVTRDGKSGAASAEKCVDVEAQSGAQ